MVVSFSIFHFGFVIGHRANIAAATNIEKWNQENNRKAPGLQLLPVCYRNGSTCMMSLLDLFIRTHSR